MFEALALTGTIPEIRWSHGDDLCDCPLQNIAESTNPYTAATMRIRLCCIYKRMSEDPRYADLIQMIPAYYDENSDLFETEPMEWNVEDSDMPGYLWYRQVAAQSGRPLEEVRDRLQHLKPPKAVPKGTGVRLSSE